MAGYSRNDIFDRGDFSARRRATRDRLSLNDRLYQMGGAAHLSPTPVMLSSVAVWSGAVKVSARVTEASLLGFVTVEK